MVLRLLFLFLCITAVLFAQPSGAQYRRSAVFGSGRLQTAFTNNGIISQPGSLNGKLSWRGAANFYLSDYSIFLGLELPIRDYTGDGNPDTLHSTIITPVQRPGGGEFGTNGIFWGFEPVSGYSNPNATSPEKGIALSTEPSTWPEVWPDHPEWGSNVWYGLNGPNQFTADEEAVFVMDDNSDAELFGLYGFLPDSTNPARKGAGIRMTVHYLRYLQGEFSDVLFMVYKIKNEGKQNYKAFQGVIKGTYIGGGGSEWNDDVTLYFPKEDFVYSYDFEQSIRSEDNPDWIGNTGGLGAKFFSVQSTRNRIASYWNFVPANGITMANDEWMWSSFTPGTYRFPASIVMPPDSVPYAIRGEDGDAAWGSGYFSLTKGETKTLTKALAAGYTPDEVMIKLKKAEAFANSGFNRNQMNQQISLTSLRQFTTISGNFPVTWNSSTTGGTVEIWLSNDLGKSWKALVREFPNNGNYTLQTDLLADNPLCSLLIFRKNDMGEITGYTASSYFRIKNGSADAWAIKISEFDHQDSLYTSDYFSVRIITAGMTSDPVPLTCYYTAGDDTVYRIFYETEIMPDTTESEFLIPLRRLPNSDKIRLKIKAGNTANADYDISDHIRKLHERQEYPASQYGFYSGQTNAQVSVHITDASQLTGNMYVISFNDTLSWKSKTFSVFNKTTGVYILREALLNRNGESQPFDGLLLRVQDIDTRYDSVRSGWNIARLNNLTYIYALGDVFQHLPYRPVDYKIEFSSFYNWSSVSFQFPGSSYSAVSNINFRVSQILPGGEVPVPFGLFQAIASHPGDLSNRDRIAIPNAQQSALIARAAFFVDSLNLPEHIPGVQDTLYFYTIKGLSAADTLIIDFVTGLQNASVQPASYFLAQNFPNPFNPVTQIKYELPQAGMVTLTIYDILGREVKTLVKENQSPGFYEVEYDAGTFASGVYLYELRVNDFSSVKKMVLLK